MLQQFPQCFGAERGEDDLTDTQWRWLQCQLLLDDGAHACPDCAFLGQGAYCGACGTRIQPEGRTCGSCHLPGTGAYCTHCGAALGTDVADAIAEKRFDWEEWARSLKPFLGGLTPQEEALLARG